MEPNPGHPTESIKSQRRFFKAAQLVENEGQQTLKPAVTTEWREVLKGCRERVRMWSARTAPQLPTCFFRCTATTRAKWRALPIYFTPIP
jgi:hypothetical protein